MFISFALLWTPLLVGGDTAAAQWPDIFSKGESIGLEKAIPANERGIVCLAVGEKGRVSGGTTGRAAHLFVYDPAKEEVRSLARVEGGIGFAYALLRMPDGTIITGTQADPTGVAVKTDPKAIGHLYRFTLIDNGCAKVEDLGVAVAGQGIYTLAYIQAANEIAGNTWPDGHFFSYDLNRKTFKDYGAIAGYRTFETPRNAEDINRGTDQKVSYPRQVSRAIAISADGMAYTGGADGFLYGYDRRARTVSKLADRLPAVPGRESWASLDAFLSGTDFDLAGTSDGFLVDMHLPKQGYDNEVPLRSLGRTPTHGTMQALIGLDPVYGITGDREGMPRSFSFHYDWTFPGIGVPGGRKAATVEPGGIPHVDGQPSTVGFGAMVLDKKGNIYAGERDRIARLVCYRFNKKETRRGPTKSTAPKPAPDPLRPASEDSPIKLPCHVVFAPQGTTTDGSGYTAIEVGKDGQVYVGAARYGDYAWLLRFDPAARPLFMEKVVNLRQLTGERLQGINTQGKIHAKIVVGADGRIWFASKQGHEVFDTRPEYAEDPNGYPGGHLCYFDPKTGFSRSMGILKRQEGLLGGAIDDVRGKLYYRSEPKNHFLVYDLKTGDVQDRGHVGAACRYMAIDRHGAVYTVGRGATICRYDPETGYVEDLAVKVEGQGGYSAPYVIALGPNGKLYGAGIAHPWIMEFDIDTYKPGLFPEVTMRNVASAAPSGMPVQDVHAGVFGKDGKFYYPLNTTGPVEKGGKPQAHVRIMRFDAVTKKTETAGVPDVVGLDEEKVKHAYTRPAKYALQYLQGAAVGPDGSLYVMAIYPQLNVACFPRLTAPQRSSGQ